MFFTRLGRIIAIVALVLGVIQIAIGLLIAHEVLGPYEAALARYGGSVSSSGKVIDRGVYMIIFSVALGILTEIRYALRGKT